MAEHPKPPDASPWSHGETPPATRCAAPWSPSAISTACIAATGPSSRRRWSARAALGRPAAALTFEPHPRSFFRPQEPLFRLTDERNKLRLLAATGLDGAIVLQLRRGAGGAQRRASSSSAS